MYNENTQIELYAINISSSSILSCVDSSLAHADRCLRKSKLIERRKLVLKQILIDIMYK